MAMNFNPKNRSSLNPLLRWLWDILSLYSREEIVIPTEFASQVLEVKSLLKSDTSGIVNSMLDFAITAACVDFTIQTSNSRLTEVLNSWTKSINSNLIGKIPIGLKALEKEYHRESWKASSFILLRTKWEKINGIELPTSMWFVDGGDLEVKDSNEDSRIIGEEIYKLRISDKKTKTLPASEDEMIFVQKPFDAWSDLYPTPFLIQRGIYKNLKILELVNKKSERIIGKALEYLLLVKKGTEQTALANNPDFIYSEDDLNKVKENMKSLIEENRIVAGTPTHVTNFDTTIENLIPDYTKVMREELFAPLEKRILAGLGLVDIADAIASSRRESVLNPKPFIAEINRGIGGFKQLLNDIVQVIIDRNTKDHRKYFASDIHIYSSPIKDFITEEIRNHVRSMYDRGVISKRTYTELCGNNVYFDIEVQLRKDENQAKLEKVMYPPIIQNSEGKPADLSPFAENVPVDKKGIEKLNYKGNLEVISVRCKKCSGEFDFEINPEKSNQEMSCPFCLQDLREEDIEIVKEISTQTYEEAPYKKNEDLPEQVKVLPSEAQDLWRRVFNQSYPKGEDYARKVAWFVVKRFWKKDKDNWVKKKRVKNEKGEWINLEKADINIDEIVRLQEAELREKQIEVADKLLDEGKINENL